MDVSLEEIRDFVTYQIGAMQAVARSEGVPLRHVKLHGALYNMAGKNPAIWDTVAGVLARVDRDLILFVLSGANRDEIKDIGARHGIRVAFEFFADRAYNPDGSLVPRQQPGAVIKDHRLAAERVLKMATEGEVVCVDGSKLRLAAETICVHGDNPAAVQLVKHIGETLNAAGVRVCAPHEFL